MSEQQVALITGAASGIGLAAAAAAALNHVIDRHIDERMRRMIHDRTSEQDLEAYARTKTPSIRAHGCERILAGETSLEEVLRVTHEE